MIETHHPSRTFPTPWVRRRQIYPPYLAVGALFGAVLLLTSCSTVPGQGSPFSGGGVREEIRIEVRNLNFSDATLWAIGGGMRRRLGVVPGKDDAAFTVPWRISQVLAIEIDLLAGVRCTTQEMIADPGDIIELQIDLELRRSGYCR